MWIVSQIQLIAFISYLYVAIYVLHQNSGDRLNRSCALFILCLAVWSLEKVFYSAPGISAEQARFWNDIGSLGWIGFSPAFLWFALSLSGNINRAHNRRLLGGVVAIGIILVIAQYQGRMIDQFILMPYGWTFHWANSVWSWFFFLYYLVVMSIGMTLLYRHARHPRGRYRTYNAMLLFVFTLVGLGLASLTDTVLPLLEITKIPPVGNALSLVWAVGLSYSIAKRRFLTLSPATAAENIISAMSDLLILTDTKGRMIRVNRAVADCLGYGRKDIEGRHISEILMSSGKSDGLMRVLGQDRLENFSLELQTRDGLSVHAILSSTPLLDEDYSSGTVTLIKDISNLYETQKALRKSENRYQELVETINEVIYSFDAKGCLTYVSPAFAVLTGYTTKEVLGHYCSNFIHPDQRATLEHQLSRLAQGRISSTPYQLRCKDGTFRWVQMSGKPVISDGKVVGANGILTDIHDQVLGREEKKILENRLARAEKMEAIGTLAGAVAHDLNNVLSGIVSYPELLLYELPEDSPLRDRLETVKNSGEKAAAIVEDLLTLARRGVTVSEKVDLNQLIREYLSSPVHQKRQAEAPGVLVQVNLTEDLGCIMGSPVHLTKTIMNLMANAFEAIPAQGGQITLRTCMGIPDMTASSPERGVDLADSQFVELVIEDTGQGIAPQDQAHIFEPFFTRKVMGRSGTGLGMAVVWGAVKDHDGYIDLESRVGQGTKFSLYFPVVPGAVRPPSGEDQMDAYLGHGQAILLVDDQPEQREIATEILTRLGYQAQSVCSGEAAIDFLGQHPVDLVILDMIMDNGMDGLDTYREMTRHHPGQRVILASGYSETQRIRTALDSGVLSCIKKPYLLRGIAAAIKEALVHPISAG